MCNETQGDDRELWRFITTEDEYNEDLGPYYLWFSIGGLLGALAALVWLLV